MMYVEPSWNSLVERLKSKDAKRIYVVGVPDSGKSTLARFLSETFAVLKPTAFIDSDPGQSTLNLPTTINAGFYPTGSKNPEVILSRFVGDTSPQHKQAVVLLALHRLTEKMQEKGAECMIFDSSGYVSGQDALEYQMSVIEMIRADVVVLLQREAELQRLKTLLQKFGTITIEEIPVSQAVRPLSMPMRKEKRESKYRAYFENQEIRVLDVQNLALCGSLPERFTVQSMRGRLLAFCDRERFVIAMGIARSFYESDKICICQAPEFDLSQIAFLHFGDIFVTSDFKEEHISKRQLPKENKN